jgi:pentatricopeptide repeat protein
LQFNEAVNFKDVVACTVMIGGLASHGQSEEAIKLFEQMKNLEINPDQRTMNSVLAACRNAGCG